MGLPFIIPLLFLTIDVQNYMMSKSRANNATTPQESSVIGNTEIASGILKVEPERRNMAEHSASSTKLFQSNDDVRNKQRQNGRNRYRSRFDSDDDWDQVEPWPALASKFDEMNRHFSEFLRSTTNPSSDEGENEKKDDDGNKSDYRNERQRRVRKTSTDDDDERETTEATEKDEPRIHGNEDEGRRESEEESRESRRHDAKEETRDERDERDNRDESRENRSGNQQTKDDRHSREQSNEANRESGERPEHQSEEQRSQEMNEDQHNDNERGDSGETKPARNSREREDAEERNEYSQESTTERDSADIERYSESPPNYDVNSRNSHHMQSGDVRDSYAPNYQAPPTRPEDMDEYTYPNDREVPSQETPHRPSRIYYPRYANRYRGSIRQRKTNYPKYVKHNDKYDNGDESVEHFDSQNQANPVNHPPRPHPSLYRSIPHRKRYKHPLYNDPNGSGFASPDDKNVHKRYPGRPLPRRSRFKLGNGTSKGIHGRYKGTVPEDYEYTYSDKVPSLRTVNGAWKPITDYPGKVLPGLTTLSTGNAHVYRGGQISPGGPLSTYSYIGSTPAIYGVIRPGKPGESRSWYSTQLKPLLGSSAKFYRFPGGIYGGVSKSDTGNENDGVLAEIWTNAGVVIGDESAKVNLKAAIDDQNTTTTVTPANTIEIIYGSHPISPKDEMKSPSLDSPVYTFAPDSKKYSTKEDSRNLGNSQSRVHTSLRASQETESISLGTVFKVTPL